MPTKASGLRQIQVPGPDGLPFRLIQANLAEQLNPLLSNALAGGHLVDAVFPSAPATDLAVQHGLGVMGVLFVLISPDRAGSVYVSPSANPLPASQLLLRASVGSLACKLYVFPSGS